MKTESATRPPRSLPQRVWRLLVRMAKILLLFVLLGQAWIFGRIAWWRTHNPATTAFMEQGLKRLREHNPAAQLQRHWVPYDGISVDLKRAVIAAEDQKFLDHEGFDWDEMEKTFEANQRRGRIRRGASTISQQLAKNLFLTGKRSYVRKAEEAIVTAMIEALLPKRRILEIYLNVTEWGDGVYGAEAAAQHYYGVGAASLDADQSAHLAAIIPNPRFYDRRGMTPYIA